jgi:UDP-MurNAc hydroxylase
MPVNGLPHDEITWINHAGYQLRTGQVRLICDPWLSGSAFDQGWDLLVPTSFSASELGKATHIWFSHEHPDHFSPADIRQIDPSQRSQITVLYQRTRDRRVASFCDKLGLKVQEVDAGIPFDIGPGVRGIIGIVGRDSWLHVETPSHTYLNMNDCVAERAEHYEAVRRASARPLDVLFTQFSYANWAGNRGDRQIMQRQASDKIKQMRRNIAETAPRFLIPFASFVFFSNLENFYLNEGVNTIEEVFALFDSAERPCIVLYPGDVWTPGTPHDSAARNISYAVARTAIQPRHDRRPVSFEELQRLASDCARRLAQHNNLWAIRLLELLDVFVPLAVRLEDLGTTVVYRPGQRLSVVDGIRPDISCSADAFAQCLRVDYGADTLLINGRFQIEQPGGLARLSRAFGVNRQNNQGVSFPWGVLSTQLLALRALCPSRARLLRAP